MALEISPRLDGQLCASEPNMLVVWTDSDWASQKKDRRSTSSFVIAFRNCVLYDLSRQQSVIAQSSAEAEVYAAASGVSSGLLLHKLLTWIGVDLHPEIGLAMDSSAGKAIISRLGVGTVRHLEVKCLWMQLLHKQRRLRVMKVKGESNVADIGTKVLAPARFEMLRAMMSMRRVDMSGVKEQEPEKRVRVVQTAPSLPQIASAFLVAAEAFVKHARGNEVTDNDFHEDGVARHEIDESDSLCTAFRGCSSCVGLARHCCDLVSVCACFAWHCLGIVWSCDELAWTSGQDTVAWAFLVLIAMITVVIIGVRLGSLKAALDILGRAQVEDEGVQTESEAGNAEVQVECTSADIAMESESQFRRVGINGIAIQSESQFKRVGINGIVVKLRLKRTGADGSSEVQSQCIREGGIAMQRH
eukprot:6491716-Amphidinium_carterae.2